MREFTCKPIEKMDIDKIELELNSRDDIPQLIKGLQYIFVTPPLRQEIFTILNGLFPPELDLDNGRPGMDRWSILVMGVLRLSLNCDYDRLHNLVNNHLTIRQILGHGQVDDRKSYTLQNLKDNVVLFTPETLDQVNQAVVKAGHELIKKKKQEDGQSLPVEKAPEDKLKGRCDSFVVETNVEYPTDTRLLFDAVRKVIELLMPVCKMVGLFDWKEGQEQIRELKKLWRQLQRLKPSSAKDEARKEVRRQAIVEAHQKYLRVARELVQRAEKTWQELRQKHSGNKNKLLKIEEFINHAQRQINHIERRVIQGETIPHQEKVFSLFEPHTEWLSKGKAGVPVELGLATCVVEDQYQFILHHRLMQHEIDMDIAVVMVQETQARFPELSSCSFDQGFHSTANQRDLAKLLDTVILPKKGRLSKAQQVRQQADEFVAGRRQHAAIESAIHALEVHGLDRCPDRGLPALRRYVALAVVARNIQLLGRYLQHQEQEIEIESYRKAA
ncbi:MAG: ISNCY family transposase [Candidatus Competibacteraceae bacterium]